MNKKWHVTRDFAKDPDAQTVETLVEAILTDRGIRTKKDSEAFLNPGDPYTLTTGDVGIDSSSLKSALSRIEKAIANKESIVVYADYDADGITAGAVLWEALWKRGARVMPYIPHRVDEGYGLSEKGIDAVRTEHDPSLIITVDHGITAADEVAYAKSLGIDVIVTDHHVKPEKLPDCTIVHTTTLSGSGVSWFIAKEVLSLGDIADRESVILPAIGTVADLLPLMGPNRSIVKSGLDAMKHSPRVGLNALIAEAGLEKSSLDTYAVSHMLAPRLNAMGRLEHALDALRLLCTKDSMKAKLLAAKLGMTNKERQQLTVDTVTHARTLVPKEMGKLLFIFHETYNPGVIGLVAGRLVEEFYRPAVVLSVGETYAKASARSVSGFNIVEAIRSFGELLVDVGGHPMAAGFTVEVKNIPKLQTSLEELAERELTEELLTRVLKIDAKIPCGLVNEKLWRELQKLQPFGFGNYEPVFASDGLIATDIRIIGATKKHLKLKVRDGEGRVFEAVAFNMADRYGEISGNAPVDMAYTIDMNVWNGKKTLQLKVKDFKFNPRVTDSAIAAGHGD